MTKHRHRHDIRKGRDALACGSAEGFGPMLNARHPRKFKLEPLDKRPPPVLQALRAAKRPRADPKQYADHGPGAGRENP